jgi:quercetin dioxygenase-like cupin family protein
MMRTAILIALAACGISSCVSIDANVETTTDAALTAFQNARVLTCPSPQADAHTSGEAQSVGVVGEDIAFTPLASDPTRSVRLRRLTIAPGGAIAWHDHRAVQGMALMVSGQMVETRNSCRERMTYRAGDVALEDAGTAHSWRNESDEPAVVLTAHVLVR